MGVGNWSQNLEQPKCLAEKMMAQTRGGICAQVLKQVRLVLIQKRCQNMMNGEIKMQNNVFIVQMKNWMCVGIQMTLELVETLHSVVLKEIGVVRDFHFSFVPF